MGTFIFGALFVLVHGETPALPRPDESFVTERIGDRSVKVFDFDERKLGNFESMPRHWRPLTGPGRPRFLEAGFDHSIGHGAAPSFKLPADGGSVAAQYAARDIHVHPGCDYEVSAWIRPEGLVHAAASLTAYYLDHALNIIPESEQHSERIRGDADGRWRHVRIRLPGGFERARWIGLTCEVAQPRNDDAVGEGPRKIVEHDASAAAWFDDITVMRLPRMSIGALGGPILLKGQPIGITALVADLDGKGIRASLRIHDADGAVMEELSVDPVAIGRPGRVVQISPLGPGRFTAQLVVRVGDQTLLSDDETFVVIEHEVGKSLPPARSPVGVILDGSALSNASTTLELLGHLDAGAVKVPVWRSDTSAESILAGEAGVNQILRELQNTNASVVAVLASPPNCLLDEMAHSSNSVWKTLAGPAENWRAFLGFVVTHYGPKVRAWQIGADSEGLKPELEMNAAITNVRNEMKSLLAASPLVLPADTNPGPPTQNTAMADIRSITLPEQLSAEQIPAYLGGTRPKRAQEFWVTLESMPSDRYPREIRLAEWGRRIIAALGVGARCVFVRQPWSFECSGDRVRPIIQEDLIVERTIGAALSGLASGGPVWLDHGVEAWLFSNTASGMGAIAAWPRGEWAEPPGVWVDADSNTRRIDLWGRATPLGGGMGERRVALETAPIIIAPVSAWRMATVASFVLDAAELQVSVAEQTRRVSLTNAGRARLTGKLRLDVPDGWRIRPATLSIDLPPGESTQCEVAFRLPSNLAEGDYVLVGRLMTGEKEPHSLTLRTPLHVGAPGLNVSVFTRSDGDSLRVFQRITNTANRPLQLSASLICAKVPRQVRLIPSLAPGQTAIREYMIPLAGGQGARYIRTSVEEIGGALRHHQLTRLK
jgi:hypothetical protein